MGEGNLIMGEGNLIMGEGNLIMGEGNLISKANAVYLTEGTPTGVSHLYLPP